MKDTEIYIVVQDSVYDYESNITIEGFVNYDDAVKRVNEIFEQDKEENPNWYEGDSYILEKSASEFSVYEDGCYSENHLNVYVKTIKLQ